eukprot:jgi/Ulvmu1/7642/UM038_0071.1
MMKAIPQVWSRNVPSSRHTRSSPGLVACSAARSARATVVENKGCNLDYSARLLQLAVHDPVDYMSGRYMTPKPLQPKWLDHYKYPGQRVEIRTQEGTAVALPICSSPSEAQTASGMGNFSIIEVVVEKHSAPEAILNAKPEDSFEISTIHGPGFSHPVNEDIKLPTFLEVKRPILVVASGAAGLAAARSAICWDSVLAIATEFPVVVTYIEKSVESAAFVQEWPKWSQSLGIHMFPLYVSEAESRTKQNGLSKAPSLLPQGQGTSLLPQHDRMVLQLEELFKKKGKINEIMGDAIKDSAVLFSGLSSQESKAALRVLKACNVPSEQILQS